MHDARDRRVVRGTEPQRQRHHAARAEHRQRRRPSPPAPRAARPNGCCGSSGRAPAASNTPGSAMLTTLTPSVVSPPKPNSSACSSSATVTAGKAPVPSMMPISPPSSRCTLDGPTGTAISEPAKKAADRIAASRDGRVVELAQAERDAAKARDRPADQHRRREDAVGDMRHRRSSFAVMSVALTQISAPSRPAPSLPSGESSACRLRAARRSPTSRRAAWRRRRCRWRRP